MTGVAQLSAACPPGRGGVCPSPCTPLPWGAGPELETGSEKPGPSSELRTPAPEESLHPLLLPFPLQARARACSRGGREAHLEPTGTPPKVVSYPPAPPPAYNTSSWSPRLPPL